MRLSPSTLLAFAWIVTSLSACQKAGVVVWPELSVLDEKAEKAEGLTERHDFKAMRALVASLQPAAARLVNSAVPANAANPAATAELKNDLKDLTTKLDDVSKLSDAELESLLAGMHPIVEQLMLKSGMPHLHEAPKP